MEITDDIILPAPFLEQFHFHLSKFELARERWLNNKDPKGITNWVFNVLYVNDRSNFLDKKLALLALNRAIKTAHGQSAYMTAIALNKAAAFGEEIGDKRVRNLGANLFYTAIKL